MGIGQIMTIHNNVASGYLWRTIRLRYMTSLSRFIFQKKKYRKTQYKVEFFFVEMKYVQGVAIAAYFLDEPFLKDLVQLAESRLFLQ